MRTPVIGWLLLFGSLALSALASPWWLLLVGFFALFQGLHWYKHRSSPWRRVHFPFMRLYYRHAAEEHVSAEREGRDYDPMRALIRAAEALHGGSTGLGGLFVLHAIEAGVTERDRMEMPATLRRRNSSLAGTEVDGLIEETVRWFRHDDPGVKLRLVVAAIVEAEYGASERAKYLVEVIRGNAH